MDLNIDMRLLSKDDIQKNIQLPNMAIFLQIWQYSYKYSSILPNMTVFFKHESILGKIAVFFQIWQYSVKYGSILIAYTAYVSSKLFEFI